MRCLVTAGPTYEPLDRVRRLTNFSTGSLGVELAGALCQAGHSVRLLRGVMATHPPPSPNPNLTVETFTTGEDLGSRLRACRSWRPDVVFHAAAVGDFRPGHVYERLEDGRLRRLRAGKFSTRGPALLVELLPTPKIITTLRASFPKARLVGWKYEVDGGPTAALTRARAQLADCNTDAVVVNGPAYGEGFGWIEAGRPVVDLPDRPALYEILVAWLALKPPVQPKRTRQRGS